MNDPAPDLIKSGQDSLGKIGRLFGQGSTVYPGMAMIRGFRQPQYNFGTCKLDRFAASSISCNRSRFLMIGRVIFFSLCWKHQIN
jgi:hypothetical protein